MIMWTRIVISSETFAVVAGTSINRQNNWSNDDLFEYQMLKYTNQVTNYYLSTLRQSDSDNTVKPILNDQN